MFTLTWRLHVAAKAIAPQKETKVQVNKVMICLQVDSVSFTGP